MGVLFSFVFNKPSKKCSAGGGVVVIVPVPLPSYDPALLLETIGNWNSVCI